MSIEKKPVKVPENNILLDGKDLKLIVDAVDMAIRQPNSNIPSLSALRFKLISQGVKSKIIEVK